jgi:hypothetical protein
LHNLWRLEAWYMQMVQTANIPKGVDNAQSLGYTGEVSWVLGDFS